MPDQPTLQFEPRTERQATHRLLREGRIPAAIFGHGATVMISLDLVTFRRVVHPNHYGSMVVSLLSNGNDAGTALVKEVQTDPVKRQIVHVDLLRVNAEDRIHVTVPIVLQGEPAAARLGGVMEQAMQLLNLRCRADAVPEQITFDVSLLDAGDVVHAGQLALPSGAELLDKPDEVIAVIIASSVPVGEEQVVVEPGVAGPDLVGDKQQSDFPTER